jgi:homoaconitase/3-isopropylmalate dehydratase large subunit
MDDRALSPNIPAMLLDPRPISVSVDWLLAHLAFPLIQCHDEFTTKRLFCQCILRQPTTCLKTAIRASVARYLGYRLATSSPDRNRAGERAAMTATMSTKILARAAGLPSVTPGDAIFCEYRSLSLIDCQSVAWIDEQGLTLQHPERIVISFDHFIRDSMADLAASLALPRMRDFAARHKIPPQNVFDVGRHGISHHVPFEEGFVAPGAFCAAYDTQAATMGVANAFVIPLISSLLPAIVTGDTWIVVPESVRINLHGALRPGVAGKDVYLGIMDRYRECTVGRAIEYGGPGLASLSLDARMAIANGSNHLGAVTSLFEADSRLLDYLSSRITELFEPVFPDPDAQYVETIDLRLDDIEPAIAAPGDPSHRRTISEVLGTPIQAAFVGSCNSGRLEELALAANELRGKQVHPGVRMVVTPATSQVMRAAEASGILGDLLAAGAAVTTPGCGSCYFGNQTPLLLADDEVCISTSVENYAGRMGSAAGRVFLANAAIVAASAVAGRIAQPEILTNQVVST